MYLSHYHKISSYIRGIVRNYFENILYFASEILNYNYYRLTLHCVSFSDALVNETSEF